MRRITGDHRGIALIEVLVSAVVLVIVAAGAFSAFSSGTRASALERNRARANALAEQELERVRALRIGDLSSLNLTRTLSADGTTYTINSLSQFLTETATTSTCASGAGSRDYLRLTASVTWPNMGPHPAVTASTIVSPPSGSLVPNSGSLLVNLTNSSSAGIPGVTLSGSGPASFTGTTGSTGCVLWRNLPAGNYSVIASGAASGMVDQDGNSPASQTVSVVDQGTNTVNLEYDLPGAISNVTFRTRDYSNALVTSSADAITASNTGMSVAKTFTPPGGVRANSITTSSTLFPFTSTYAVWAGSCGSNNPGAGSILGNVNVPSGGSGALQAPGYIQLPSLLPTVWSGTIASPGSRVAGVRVIAHDRDPTCNISRDLTPSAGTNANGQVPQSPPAGGDVGLPYGTYDICVTNAARTQHRLITPIPLITAALIGTPLNVYLGGGGLINGTSCP